MRRAYGDLHRLGHAHSVECWDGDRLVGGLYGLALGRAFFGESMFSRASDASKVALAALVARLRVGGFTLLDCQFMTDHLASLGAVEIRQSDYLERLGAADIHFPPAVLRLCQRRAEQVAPPVRAAAGNEQHHRTEQRQTGQQPEQ